MKTTTTTIIKILVFALIFSTRTNAQNPNWINYTNGDNIADLANDNNILWISTAGGIVKFDKASGDKTFYNKGNSGLPRNYVRGIDTDSSGNLWLASAVGLSFYDGTNWILYDTANSGLPTKNLMDVTVDKNGVVWIASSSGVTTFDGTNWFTYDTSNSTMNSPFIRKIFVSPTNEKWFVTVYGIDHFDGTTWTFYNSTIVGASVYNIYNITFKNNDVYVSSSGPFGQGNGLIKFDGAVWSSYTPANSGLPYSNVDYVTTDTSGNLWIANSSFNPDSNSLVKYDGINWTSFLTPSNIFGGTQLSILITDSNNRIFTGTQVTGLTEFINGNFTDINTSNCGINHNGGEKIFIDDQNEAWITNFTGFTHFDNQTWEVFDTTNSSFLNSYISDITLDHSGSVWVGSHEGLIKYDGSNWFRYDTSNSGLGNNYVQAVIADSANSIWAGTNTAPFKFDGNTWTSYFSNAGSHIIDLFVTEDADVWMGSPGYGLSRFDLNNLWLNYSPPLAGASYKAGAMDKNGHVWVGGNNLHQWNGSTWAKYGTAEGLPWQTITALAVDTNNMLWIGTSNGLSKFDGVTFTNYFNENSGLTANYISDIKVDDNNNKWIATSEGVSVFNENGIVLDINEEYQKETESDVLIYPVPFINTITLDLKNMNPAMNPEFTIYDLTGRVVFNKEIKTQQSEIKIENHSPGVYIYILKNENKIISKGKLIAQ
jgi:ligand-binding sensor domain-containing protein